MLIVIKGVQRQEPEVAIAARGAGGAAAKGRRHWILQRGDGQYEEQH